MRFKKKRILLLGSGGLKIGQAGEFDYSGSQAIKALKEEGVVTILINPNIATVQTDSSMADVLYLQPLTLETVAEVIHKERPDGILFGFGGQTALNLGLALDEAHILSKYSVEVLGTPVQTIKVTEDRALFKKALAEIDVHTAKSIAVNNIEDAFKAAEVIGYPVMMRSGYSLGGLGSGKIHGKEELARRALEALNAAPQILIEEYLEGWKEIEYEIVRDGKDQTLIVCNMENFDPMGIHTGESIVVAPSQTLSNSEYHLLREIAIKTARHLGILGECNIQYAFNPENGEYRVIEVNARLSRSSALASKATGYPLAFVAAKIALGYGLHEIQNSITEKTSAFFEPALDYLVVKMPRWDTHKFKSADHSINSEMKSVGEVMAIGRNFPEALQKAVRMLNIGAHGVTDHPFSFENPVKEIQYATHRRLFAIVEYLKRGGTLDEVRKFSHIDPWFLWHLEGILDMEREITDGDLSTGLLKRAKQAGFSDITIAKLHQKTEQEIREKRLQNKVVPVIKQIDTLAGEFDAKTNYLYMTYHGSVNDVLPSFSPPIAVIGAGPYCIGSSVEFDWCAVNMVKALRKHGENTLIINSNPETVSTDYDCSDRLYFEELTFERICDIAEFESPKGIVVSVGGQIANNLSLKLHRAGFSIMGTAAESIDIAENRYRFSTLLYELGVDQPAWHNAVSIEGVKEFAALVGYPVLVRPSYVLSGAAMNVVSSDDELQQYLGEAVQISKDLPVVVSKFILDAKELEIDGVADKGAIVIESIVEHVENAGVHSGDATLVLPPQHLYLETIRQAKKISRNIVRNLNITGPFNIQFIAKDNVLKVIECNLRAARSFPFVSKVTNHNFIEIAAEVMIGKYEPKSFETLELDYVGIKCPQFSYSRLKGSNPVAHVEMASTGETACIGENLLDAFYASWIATEQKISGKRILVSVGKEMKIKLLKQLCTLESCGWEIYATDTTHKFLASHGVGSLFLHKPSERMEPNAASYIGGKLIDLIINIPENPNRQQMTDGFMIRRLAIDHHIPLVTNVQIAELLLRCLTELDLRLPVPKSWQEFVYPKYGEEYAAKF